jgi:putative ABC transport system permease protein
MRRPQPFATEVRTALRAITRRPATSLVLIATIGLGIGATTAIFTVVDTVLLRPLPFHEPARLANIWTLEKDGFSHPGVQPEVADYWRDRAGVFSRVESFVDRSMLYRGIDEPTDVRATIVSHGIFSLLGVRPAVGRTFLADDASADAPNVVVVSDAFWRTKLGASPTAVGRPVVLDGRQYLVIGVMPPWFRYPLGTVAMWLPLKPGGLTESEQKWVSLVGRVRDDITPAVAQDRVRQLTTQLNASAPRSGGWSVSLFFLDRNTLNTDVKRTLIVLAGAVLCLLLIACANAANILLVRATARQRELAIRAALGATRGTLVRQLVIESLLLALLGGAAGVIVAYWSVDLLLLIVPREMSYLTYSSISIDGRVLAFATIASVVTGLLFGVGPAIRASRARGTFFSQDRSGTTTRSTTKVRGALIVGEVAVSLVLLAGAGLFARSFIELTGVSPGFDADRLLTAELTLPNVRYPTPEQRVAAVDAYLERLRALPGVTGVSVSLGVPPRAGVTFADRLEAEAATAPVSDKMTMIPFTLADTGYFSTLGIGMVSGRTLSEDDRRSTDKRAVIDVDLARALFPSGDAVGRRFRLSTEEPWITVVGVAADVKMLGPDDAAGKYAIYYPLSARLQSTRNLEFALRVSGDPRRSAEAVKRAIWSVDPQQPIASVAPVAERMGDAVAKPRFLLTLMGVFAGAALALAVIGLYGVLSHAVAYRTREIGIRMALGAQTATVLRGVLGYGSALTALGILIGLGVTMAGGRVVRTLLFGVTPLDPPAIAAAGVVLGAAALVACYIPARRATRVDPLEALRAE